MNIIKNIERATIEKILNKSAHVLPDNPTACGMSPREIKEYLHAFVTDSEDSVLSELIRVIEELNAYFDNQLIEDDDIVALKNGNLYIGIQKSLDGTQDRIVLYRRDNENNMTDIASFEKNSIYLTGGDTSGVYGEDYGIVEINKDGVFFNGDILLTHKDIYIETTYNELLELRNSSKLIKGAQYRITDYECTTTQENTRSAGHQFDIIVTADDVNIINENARAVKHDGDTYFAHNALEAWELKYTLDNDTSRFLWADEENGKGVIYYMKDDHNNECPYDFKNIQFARYRRKNYNASESGLTQIDPEWNSTVGYELTGLPSSDYTPVAKSINSIIYDFMNQVWYENVFPTSACDYSRPFDWQFLSPNTPKTYFTFTGRYFNEQDSITELRAELQTESTDQFKWFYTFSMSSLYEVNDNMEIYDATVWRKDYLSENNAHRNNVIQVCREDDWTTKAILNNIVFFSVYDTCFGNVFDADCKNMSFGQGCNNNTFGSKCSDNTFGSYWYECSFGNEFSDNTLGSDSYYNVFGDECKGNTSCDYLTRTTFGENFYSNQITNIYESSFGNTCNSSTIVYFNNSVAGNNFANNIITGYFSNSIIGNSFQNNIIGNSVSGNTFGNNIQYVEIGNEVQGCSFGDGCEFIALKNENIDNDVNVRNIIVRNGLKGSSERNKLNLYDQELIDKDYNHYFEKDAQGHFLMTWKSSFTDNACKYKSSVADTEWTLKQ